MSEKSTEESVEKAGNVQNVEMQDAQEWSESVDEASGTTCDPSTSEIPPTPSTPVLFTPDSGSIGDPSLPDELRELISVGGVRLVRCEQNVWNVQGWAAKLKKNLSVTFSIDEDITGEHIMDGLEHAGFDVEKVVSIQRRISTRSWVVTFSEQREKDRVISKGRLKIKDTIVFLGDADSRTDIVKIFEAPDEMPDTVVIGRLSCFGKILSFRRDVAPATGVRNGVRTARMRISRDIPCIVNVAGEKLSIKYSSQPKSCRRCGGFGHFQGNCKDPRCYNCDTPGHRAMDCEESVLCGVCLRSTHPLSECPFVVFSANVEPSYAETTKSPRPERTPEQREAMRAAADVAAKEKEKQRQKQRAEREKEREKEKEKEKEREREREKQRDKERAEKRREEDRREKERADERAKRRRKEEEDEKERERRRREEEREKERGRERDRDRDWSRTRDHYSRERDRDHTRYRDERYYKDRDYHYRDTSPHYSDDGRRRR